MNTESTRAIQMSSTGGPEVLQLADVALPALGGGDAVVEIEAAGVNFIDVYERTGVYPVSLPYVPGLEGAGRIVALGADALRDSGFAVGDRVAWEWIRGSYAADTIGAADRLVPVPDEVSAEQAAAVVLQGMTAHYLATDSYPIRDGDTVLVHAGAGGVGLLLTQIAVLKGATVLTTVSTEAKAQLSRQAGATDVIVGYDGVAEAVRDLTTGEGVQAVYDGVGRDTFDASLDALARRGTLVLFGGSSGQVPPFDIQRLNRGGSLTLTRPTLVHFTVDAAERRRRADDLFGWMRDGRLEVRIGQTYPLGDAGRAQEDLAGRRTTGKVLLLP